METILLIITLMAIGYAYSCIDNFTTWFKYERGLPTEYQRHKKWWKI